MLIPLAPALSEFELDLRTAAATAPTAAGYALSLPGGTGGTPSPGVGPTPLI